MKTYKQFLTENNALDKDGNQLEDLNGTPVKSNSDGTITLYHRTTPKNAENIKKTKKWISKENTQEIWFSTHKHGQAESFGNGIVKIKIHPRYTRISDAFRNGEVHVAIHKSHIKPRHIQTDE